MPIPLLLALLATCLASPAGQAQHGTPFDLRNMTPTIEGAEPGREPGPEDKSVPEVYRRPPVFYRTNEAPGTIIIDTSERFLYLIQGKYGLAVDNLLSDEVVLASGDVVVASGEEELFWALRGGGGNFGVVTSFEFRAYPLVGVLGGAVLWPFAAVPTVFSFFREFSADLPDDLSLQAILAHAPDGSGAKLCGIAGCHAGADGERAAADLQPLRELGSPVADMLQQMPYPAVNTGADWVFPRGALNYWKSAFFSELSDAAVAVIADAFERAPSKLCAIGVEEFHGA